MVTHKGTNSPNVALNLIAVPLTFYISVIKKGQNEGGDRNPALHITMPQYATLRQATAWLLTLAGFVIVQ